MNAMNGLDPLDGAHARLRRRIDFSFEIGTALIMPVQGQAAEAAVGEVHERVHSFSTRTFSSSPVGGFK